MMKENSHHPARYWHKIDGTKIQCELCPRICILKEDQKGFCLIRKNVNGQMITKAYGHSSGFCVDPIEKKPLYHFYPGSNILSFGTAGCNMGCIFCQNWHLSRAKEVEDLLQKEASPQTIAQAAKKSGCASVAFTYNEPIISIEYTIDTAQACHELGIKTVAVTAGYINKRPRADFFSAMDATNVDLKSFHEDFYQKMSAATLAPVLETLEYLKKETNVWVEITNLIIPSHNDSQEEINAMTQWIVKTLGEFVPVHFSAFHPSYKLTNIPSTSSATLKKAREIGLKNGLRYVYTGNVIDHIGSNTYCYHCGELLIKREGFSISSKNLIDNRCKKCQTTCHGFF